MLLKRRSPQIEADQPVEPSPGFEHLEPGVLATLRWLTDHKVEFVLTGSVAGSIHTRTATRAAVAIVPAPYRRNLERLARGLTAAKARVHNAEPAIDPVDVAPVKVDLLSGTEVLTFVWDTQRLDVVGTGAPAASGASGASGYQELLYETGRFELSPGLTVEVASPEDIEHFAHLRSTGTAPQIKITRQTAARSADTGQAPKVAPGPDSLPG
jgi:hypothetical protein